MRQSDHTKESGIRPLRRAGEGKYISRDGRWTFLRDDHDTPGFGGLGWQVYDRDRDDAYDRARLLDDLVAVVERAYPE